MTTTEFSNEFDVLYNNIMSNAAPGLNEYEKSVFLTKAQDEIIFNYFNPNGNKYKEGFDDSPKRQIDFSELIANTTVSTPTTIGVFDLRGQIFILPVNVLLILNESFVNNSIHYRVVPIDYQEYDRVMSKPFKEPLKSQVWRLIKDGATIGVPNVEIIPHSGTLVSPTYSIRYIKRPAPIVLSLLTGIYANLTINGISAITECELNPIVHRAVLDRAVELAKAAYTGDLKAIVELDTRNE